MATDTTDVLFEIGCEELPASFVEGALEALPGIAAKRLGEQRLAFRHARALGTPRRLALIIEGLAQAQPDLDEEVQGPPTRAAFKDGIPTRAAEAFADKLGVAVADLRRVDTPKGEYLVGSRREKGRPAMALLPAVLQTIARDIPFRKSMRWADLDFPFGRPIQWIVALAGSEVISFDLAAIKSGRLSRGHRFLHPAEVSISSPSAYIEALRGAHVLVDPAERRVALAHGLADAALRAGGVLIPDAFLLDENLTLVEEPHVLVGAFDRDALELPERVILEVARGHQRYFGLRDQAGKLMPNYLAVANTALDPVAIVRGNDSVMRARLADARFFYKTDLAIPLARRREKLGGVVFQKKLGSVLGKVERVERLVQEIGSDLKLPPATIAAATQGAHLAKCDLVSLMVGEFPELQGDMGAAYARAQGIATEVADVIADHYRPKGAQDATAKGTAAALVALADRVDTLVGCFSVGLAPTGTADPFALRRACLAILRTMIDHAFDLSIPALVGRAHAAFGGVTLDLNAAEATEKIGEFVSDRLRGLLADRLAADAVRAAIATAPERPLDVKARATAVAALDDVTRAKVGEVFKRATNIAKDAKTGDPTAPPADAHASEHALHAAYQSFSKNGDALLAKADYGAFLGEVAAILPVMERYFLDVFVMTDDLPLRDNRLRLMRAISERCALVARLELLAA